MERYYKSYATDDIQPGEYNKLPGAILSNLCQIPDWEYGFFGLLSILALIRKKGIFGQDLRLFGTVGLLFNGGMLIAKRTGLCR